MSKTLPIDFGTNSDDQIKVIQKQLHAMGVYHGPISGVIDEGTWQAIQDGIRNHNQSADGSRDVPKPPDTLLTPKQVSEQLQISIRTLEGWRLSGSGPPFVRAGGRRVLYRWAALLSWLKEREVSSTSETSVS